MDGVKTFYLTDIAFLVSGILLLLMSFFTYNEVVSLGLMCGAMFSFAFLHLTRVERKLDAIYEELMAYEIVEEEDE